MLIAIYNRGGHCDFFMKEADEKTKKDIHLQYVVRLAMKYFDEVDNYRAQQ